RPNASKCSPKGTGSSDLYGPNVTLCGGQQTYTYWFKQCFIRHKHKVQVPYRVCFLICGERFIRTQQASLTQSEQKSKSLPVNERLP
uniref:Uncharacterized protein n=1 Tax=Chelonoidis abingdonii TaxID=106734 RepID=A0A8C0H3D6_CHEAB